MERSYNDVKIIRNKNDEAIGIDLGWNFKAEHEQGYELLANIFGLDNTQPSYHANKMNRKYKDFEIYHHFAEGKCQINKVKRKWARLIIGDPYQIERTLKQGIQKPYRSETIVTLWQKYVMAIYAWDDESISLLKEINEELKNNNIFLACSVKDVGWPSSNGLSISIASKWDQDFLDKVYHEYIDEKQLEKTAQETGIFKKLEKAKLKFYALSPSWTKNIFDLSQKTKHDVVFYLNPREQAKFNSGWYTVEELIAWTKGKGPIIK